MAVDPADFESLSRNIEILSSTIASRGVTTVTDATGRRIPTETYTPGPDGNPAKSVLEEIRDAIKALHETEKKKEETGEDTFHTLMELVSLGFFTGNTPTTSMGRFAQRAYHIGLGTYGKIRAIRKLMGRGKGGGTGGGRGGGSAGGLGAAVVGAGAGGKVTSSIAGVAGGVGMAAVFASAVVKFGEAVYSFAQEQEKEIRRLAQFGGEQALGTALLDANRAMRDIEKAQNTGDSSRGLTESINEFEKALAPIETLVTNISNNVAGSLLDMVTGVLEAVEPVVDVLNDILTALGGKGGKKEPVPSNWNMMAKIADEQERLGAPKWPNAALPNAKGR